VGAANRFLDAVAANRITRLFSWCPVNWTLKFWQEWFRVMDLLDRPLALFYDARRARTLDALLSSSVPMTGREVARRADLSPTTANLALGDLETAGLVRRRVDGRAYRWQLRDDNALVGQIRQLARVQDAEAAQVVVDALGAEPVSITLFGSAARGESGAASDVDLLLVAADLEQDRLFRRRAYRVSSALRSVLGRPVHVIVMDKDKLVRERAGAFVVGVLRDGRPLRGAAIQELVP
jgi:predicted nucleotidyltransferase